MSLVIQKQRSVVKTRIFLFLFLFLLLSVFIYTDPLPPLLLLPPPSPRHSQDNVFVKVSVAVQYFVIADKVYDAYYKLTDHRAQIRSTCPPLPSCSSHVTHRSYVFDGIRSSLPKLDLDHAFSSKNEIADNVKNSLADLMDDYGYRILNVLIIDLDPDNAVKNAMNEINGQPLLDLR
jgi:regulator of protease activity HflC (stomatin/prohibitin superfamily)